MPLFEFNGVSVTPVLLVAAFVVVAFVTAQSMFFIIKSWKHGKELGIKTETMKKTVVSSIMFTVAPAISILATVITLSKALGVFLPWIRLTVIGNLAYETTAAQTALDCFQASLRNAVTDPAQFSTITWAMTLGSIAPLLMLPFVCKKLQKKINQVTTKKPEGNDKKAKLMDSISAAAFIGIICAFIAREINGKLTEEYIYTDALGKVLLDENGEQKIDILTTSSAGLMSITILISSVIFMLLFTWICKKFKLEKLESFAMPLAMFCAMAVAVILVKFVPGIEGITWYPIDQIPS